MFLAISPTLTSILRRTKYRMAKATAKETSVRRLKNRFSRDTGAASMSLSSPICLPAYEVSSLIEPLPFDVDGFDGFWWSRGRRGRLPH